MCTRVKLRVQSVRGWNIQHRAVTVGVSSSPVCPHHGVSDLFVEDSNETQMRVVHVV
jgi:hypothetical protein